MPIQREYLSPNEIGEYLGISPFTIRRYIKLGELKAVKLLGSFRVHKNDLQAFLKAHEVNPAEESLEAEDEAEVTNAAPPSPLPRPPPTVSGVREIPVPQNPPRRPRGRPRKTPLPM
jgi:excisionase family DNA binding protein